MVPPRWYVEVELNDSSIAFGAAQLLVVANWLRLSLMDVGFVSRGANRPWFVAAVGAGAGKAVGRKNYRSGKSMPC